MQRTVGKRKKWLGWAAALVVIAGGSVVCVAAMAGAGDTFDADVSIRHALVDAKGGLLRASPPTQSLHIARSMMASGNWKTTVTLRSQEKPSVRWGTTIRQLDNPFLIARMEYDGDGSAPRLYNVLGQLVPGPTDADRRLLASPVPAGQAPIDWDATKSRLSTTVIAAQSSDWIDTLIATPAKRTDRRKAIEAQFGKARSRVNGLDRHLLTEGNAVHEMFVNPDAVVPVELNTVENGVLVARTMFGYEPRADGSLVRRLAHAERVVPEVTGARAITDVELTNVVVVRGGR